MSAMRITSLSRWERTFPACNTDSCSRKESSEERYTSKGSDYRALLVGRDPSCQCASEVHIEALLNREEDEPSSQ